MGFRTVVINSRCKLEYRLNYLVVRGETERKIFIHEINTIIVQSTAVSLTAALLCECVGNGIKIIFCDEKCNPQSELIPYHGAHNTTKRFKRQFLWEDRVKAEVWRRIIREKIGNQADLLYKLGFLSEAEALLQYKEEVLPSDASNREGHAAKVYFNCILPDGVARRGGGFLNTCLNYGYAVVTSAFNREIAASGYLTQLGIWHDNEFNPFNLACDLMEPLRPVVDETALSIEETDKEFKKKMANILNYSATVNGKRTTLDIAVRTYARSVIYAVEENKAEEIAFPKDIKAENEL